MSLSDDQVRQLLHWYASSSQTRKNSLPRRIMALEANQQWVDPKRIAELSDQELSSRYVAYFNSGGGRQSLNAIHRDRIVRDIKKFRETLLLLLNESHDIKERLEAVLGGRSRIIGFGKALATSFLMDLAPEKYGLWNGKTEAGLRVLGWELPRNNDSWGDAYAKILRSLNRLIELGQPEVNSLNDVDLFLHTIAAVEEGITAVKAIREGKYPPSNDAEKPEPVSTSDEENLMFGLEKHLEEFLLSNFDKVHWGAALELHQDEERNGHQYKIDIGVIDLLARDDKENEFVVIELKRGPTSSATVGQISSYIGWLQENLPRGYDNYGVRGIIISSAFDEKIRYALKNVPNVSFYQYRVNFELAKSD